MTDQTIPRWRFTKKSIVFCVLAVVHALLVLGFWIAAFQFDEHMVSARVWLLMAWGWLIWLVVLAPRLKQEARLVIPTLLVCVGVLVPCVSTVYTFTVWAFQ